MHEHLRKESKQEGMFWVILGKVGYHVYWKGELLDEKSRESISGIGIGGSAILHLVEKNVVQQ